MCDDPFLPSTRPTVCHILTQPRHNCSIRVSRIFLRDSMTSADASKRIGLAVLHHRLSQPRIGHLGVLLYSSSHFAVDHRKSSLLRRRRRISILSVDSVCFDMSSQVVAYVHFMPLLLKITSCYAAPRKETPPCRIPLTTLKYKEQGTHGLAVCYLCRRMSVSTGSHVVGFGM